MARLSSVATIQVPNRIRDRRGVLDVLRVVWYDALRLAPRSKNGHPWAGRMANRPFIIGICCRKTLMDFIPKVC
jgi:hypothetical protein